MKLTAMTQRELLTMSALTAIACFLSGAMLIGLFVALHTLPQRDAEALQRIETAYAKGAMIKIASRPTKCREFAISSGVARCVS